MSTPTPTDVFHGIVAHAPMYGPPREALALLYGVLTVTRRGDVDLHDLWLRALAAVELLQGNVDRVETHADVVKLATWFLAHEARWAPAPDAAIDLLFVTGHRALAEHAASAWWASQQIQRRLVRMAPGAILVTGDAAGPDTWAREFATGLVRVVYGKDGCVTVEAPGEAPRVTRWLPPKESLPTTSMGWSKHLHRRNRVMVDAVATKRAQAPTLRIAGLALRCTWSDTDGTGMTTRYAVAKPEVFNIFDVETYRAAA